MDKTIRELAEEMVKSVLREYNSVANIRVTTDAGPGFVMLDSDNAEATNRAIRSGVAWFLRYETSKIQDESAPVRRGRK